MLNAILNYFRAGGLFFPDLFDEFNDDCILSLIIH